MPPTSESKTSKPVSLAEMVTSQFELLRAYHVSVLQEESVEAIHRMRVTTRRLQAAVDLLQKGPLSREVKRVKKKLREWRGLLSEVRNYDVFLILVEKEASSRRGQQKEQFELLHAILQKRRANRAALIRKKLKNVDIEALALILGVSMTPIASGTGDGAAAGEEAESEEVHSDSSEETSNDEPAPIMDESAVALTAADRIDQRLAEFQLRAAQSHPTTDPYELHQLRIAAKRLRYLMETASLMGFGTAPAALVYLKSIQDRIGEWHDLHALEEEILGIVSRRKFVRKNLAECSTMLRAALHLQKKKEALVAKLFPVRIPKTVATSAGRFARALRRPPAARAMPQTTDSTSEH